MRWIGLVLALFIGGVVYCQELDKVKHVELISEVSDTMALINKTDINKINKTFHEKRMLDSLFVINEEQIKHLNEINSQLDSIALSQLKVINNDKLIIKKLNRDQADLQRKLNKAHKTIFWESTVGAVVILVLCLLL